MEPYVTPHELSQLLKEAGTPQETQYMWVKFEFWEKHGLTISDIAKDVHLATLSGARTDDCAAYTAEELIVLLPKFIWAKSQGPEALPLNIDWGMDYPKAYYWRQGTTPQGHAVPYYNRPPNLASDLAYLYFWLVKLEYLNGRLPSNVQV